MAFQMLTSKYLNSGCMGCTALINATHILHTDCLRCVDIFCLKLLMSIPRRHIPNKKIRTTLNCLTLRNITSELPISSISLQRYVS